MVNVQYFQHCENLEDIHLGGPAIVSGLDRRAAMDFSDEVIKGLRTSKSGLIGFEELTEYSSRFIGDPETKRKYTVLNNYMDNVYAKRITQPFYIFIGGAASTGKDTLVQNLQYLLRGFDRVTGTDSLREQVRTEVIQEHEGRENVPAEKLYLFEALFNLKGGDMHRQIEAVKRKVPEYFLQQAESECKGWMHPFYVLQGTHVVPGFEEVVDGENKMLAIVSPSQGALASRVRSRQDRERGPVGSSSEGMQRSIECRKTIGIRDYLQGLAMEKGNAVINEDHWLKTVQSFGEHLVGKLESVLEGQRVSV